MSDPAQPLSRRERRAMEEAARAAEGDVTQALPVAPETESIMSRRERRRLERLTNPLEQWTEEEELIATGQMPAMTPEVIAEQERLANERAAAAAYAETALDAVVESAPDAGHPARESQDLADAGHPARESQDLATPEQPAEPSWEPQPTPSAIPADLRHLFPPGSLQARAYEQQQAATAAQPVVTDPAAADEIRQLTHEAMAGITRANTGATPAVDEQVAEPIEDFPAPIAQATPVDVPALPEGVDVEALWNAPTVDEPVRESVLPVRESALNTEPPVDLADVPFVQEIPVPTEPTGAESVGVTPVWSALVPAAPAPVQEQRPAQVAPVEEPAAPTMWDTHPFMNPGASPVRELPTEPVRQELPRPDLSALLNTQANPTVGQQAELRSTEPLTSTGALPQRVAEPVAGGGTRHFRWAHLAVIGAIAFVLGVLAWNIARSNS